MKSFRLDAIALLAGIFLPFAFAPFYFSILAFFAPGLLLYTWLSSSPSLAFRRGFLFGIGLFGVGISWVYVSIHVFGQAPIPIAILITAIFVCYLSLLIGLQGYCLNRFLPNNDIFKILCAFPCSWVLFEFFRTWLFTGFPWLLLGYSQSNTFLKGYASIFGVYGITWIVVFCSGLLLILYKNKNVKTRLTGLGFLLIIFLSGYGLSTITWTKNFGKELRTTLVQGNIDQELKWQPEQVAKSLALYLKYTQKNWASDIIIWPEAAITLPLDQMEEYLDNLGELAKKNHSAIITGIPIVEPNQAFNSMITIGNGKGVYHKRHLVPFGEYTPLKPFYGFMLKAFNIPMSNFLPGAKAQLPLYANGTAIAPYICYEVAYPIEFLSFLPESKLLLTITDDSWFGHSIAAAQHLQMAQLRAMETQRYLLFSSNTGITAAIDAKGNIVKSIPAFEEAELTAIVQPMSGSTPWMIWKLYPISLLIALTFLVGWVKRNRKAFSKDSVIAHKS